MKLTNRSKVVSNKKMTFGESIYLPAIFKGMGITMSHAVKTVFWKRVVHDSISGRSKAPYENLAR